uniref:Secreted protein n=1 Tax=Octopus bimaculoides TaxID=37653 RepID=A0A0L8HBK1_OCTBM
MLFLSFLLTITYVSLLSLPRTHTLISTCSHIHMYTYSYTHTKHDLPTISLTTLVQTDLPSSYATFSLTLHNSLTILRSLTFL